MIQAIQAISQKVKEGAIEIDQIDEALVEDYLFTARYGAIAKPDLVIRTSGEQRLSNFLLWQSAYSEWKLVIVTLVSEKFRRDR